MFLLAVSVGIPAWAQGVVTGAGYRVPLPPAVAPNQIVTFLVSGLGAVPRAVNTGTPIGNTLSGVTAVVKQPGADLPAPIFAIEPLSTCPDSDQSQPGCGTVTALTVLIPPGMRAVDPNTAGTLIGPTYAVFTGPSSAVATLLVNPLVDQIHVLATCDLVFQQRQQSCRPVATHADGAFITAETPAKPGEEIVIYTVGLGDFGRVRVQFDYRVNAQPSGPLVAGSQPPSYAGAVPGFPGLYQVNVVLPDVPAGTPNCSASGGIVSNLTISVAGAASFDGAALCVQVPGT